MNALPHDDELVLRVDVSTFRDTQDAIPRPAHPTYRELIELLAPERPPVRRDLVATEARRLRDIDAAEACLLADDPPPRWLVGSPTYRRLERVAWTAGGAEARAAGVVRAAADARDVERRRTKQRLPCWSPVRCHPHTTRGIAAVDIVTCLVLDYDDGTPIDVAIEPWLDWPLIVATTWSHTAERPRFRVSLVLETPVPAAMWGRAWRWAAARAVGVVDPACKDPCRLYALPAVRSPDAPYERRVHDPGGHLLGLDWRRLPAAEEPAAGRPITPSPPRGGSSLDDERRRIARAAFGEDEGARRRAAVFLGANVTDRRAEHVRCPACGRPSVWFWLAPGQQNTASCHHKASCGWWGHLDELLDAIGGCDGP